MASISLTNVQKAYDGGQTVIRNVHLEVGRNEFCVFLGPSGCGKSTLLRMIAGLESITSGELRIDGQLMNDVAPAKRRVAMVFQNYALYPHMSVYENMAFGLRQAKIDKATIDTKVRRAASALQLDAFLERRPAALSGGQRQRVAIGRAIVREPGVFLFDEPLSNLDAALRVQTRTEIARLHREFSEASAVYVTHDQIEAMALADKIVLLQAGLEQEKHGSIAQVGAPLDLYHHPKSRFVAGFIGSPKMNFLPGLITAVNEQGVEVELTTGERVRARVDGRQSTVGMKVTLGIRPEHLAVAGGAGREQAIRGKVRLVERMGEHSYVHVDGGGSATMIAKVAGDARLEPDEVVSLALPDDACHLFDDRDLAFRRVV
ncbi:ABC transporter ATP-binding protein [Paraburkholderia caballeronis]|uniref:ABC transporter ATP-binding protein n=1 Tax=Paraburkholderia caballeronis TaxID=416943 RepID=UPI001066CEFF|nr:sn-glycerol-3-phosphate ABC transporter ATP-binding protein UgpC [Paraburkholderia caballeronis]TDV16429.1 carbohydrate ABC transporter ATP-binding protein (CUT1 family) [Paraburkholderia caballeronis]TDV18825.1 carbohydrate ABC transporter ATP-binding protein (CUT1 family) [Paraburkholderia caballeronis]TDV26958.1 carbohydrate ABC transporter ATP-binding protein (CUT1 family) [Paraburkholderia caballeronis]